MIKFNTGLDLTRALIERMESKEDGEIFTNALKKLVNMKTDSLQKFLGKVRILFGRLQCVVPNIALEAIASFKPCDFFKIKSKGGIFAYVDDDLLDWFDEEVKNSPAREIANYEFTENIAEENIIDDAKTGEIYEEYDLAHIKQVCERHIVGGEKILKENGSANLFWVRNKQGDFCRVYVWLGDVGWSVSVDEFDGLSRWGRGCRSFFRSKTFTS